MWMMAHLCFLKDYSNFIEDKKNLIRKIGRRKWGDKLIYIWNYIINDEIKANISKTEFHQNDVK